MHISITVKMRWVTLSSLIHHMRWRARLLLSQPGDWLLPWLFFMAVVAIFPLALPPGRVMLQTIAPGIIWVAALLGVMLSLQTLFLEDLHDGTVLYWAMKPEALSSWVGACLTVHCLFWLVPMTIAMPILSLMMGLSKAQAWVLWLGLFIGLPSLFLVGAMLRTLSLVSRGGQTLLMLLILPLMVPVLILGTGAVFRVMHGFSPWPLLALLLAYGLLVILCSSKVCTLALQWSVQEIV